MPTAGLSLVGFMPREAGIENLKAAAIWAVADDVTLGIEWQKANAALGPLIPNAGNPDVQPIPASHQAYVDDLISRDWYQRNEASWFAGATFGMVEADPLLAYQVSVDLERSNHHCGSLTQPPTLDELFELCLPRALPVEQWDWTRGPQSLLIRSRSLNLRVLGEGLLGQGPDGTLGGLYFGSAAPLVHVVRFNGRCYLHNGFHRVVGARCAGATHVPCVIRDVAGAEELGLTPPTTFDLSLLESADPPTVGHYTQGRALNVQLRATTRILHISWANYALANE